MSNNFIAKIQNELDSPKVYGDKDGQFCIWIRSRAELNNRVFWRFKDKSEAMNAANELEADGKYAYVLKDGIAGEVLQRSEDEY